uniref:Uncharacterized protein n=1 Tax=Arundo donax TaxID=35708 RepID=A0A0A9ECF4_ARUDO
MFSLKKQEYQITNGDKPSRPSYCHLFAARIESWCLQSPDLGVRRIIYAMMHCNFYCLPWRYKSKDR